MKMKILRMLNNVNKREKWGLQYSIAKLTKKATIIKTVWYPTGHADGPIE